MYIKQVIIRGFKSYGERVDIESFDKKMNVIVGKNGSGKSNFFHAIQFVLNDEYAHLGLQERQKLLYNGTGPRVTNAFVEIVIDNSDGRMPIKDKEVLIRRTIGDKSDQYFLNKKIIMRGDLQNLLESAGFCRANPYHVVRQGQIHQMASASNAERLKLIQEISGTRIYDEHQPESKAMIEEIEMKKEKIASSIQKIQDQYQILLSRRGEFREFYGYTEMKKALEHKILDREIEGFQQELDKLKPQLAANKPKREELRLKIASLQNEVSLARERRKEVEREFKKIQQERETSINDREKLLREKIELNLKIDNLSDEMKRAENRKKENKQHLMEMEDRYAQKKNELKVIEQRYFELKRKENEIILELSIEEQRHNELCLKKGRAQQFPSKDERNKWLEKELSFLREQINETKTNRQKVGEDLKKKFILRKKLDEKLKADSEDLKKMKQMMNDHRIKLEELVNMKNEIQGKRKAFLRAENDHKKLLADREEELAEINRILYSKVGLQIIKGFDSVKKVLSIFSERHDEDYEIGSYHGPVIENFEYDKGVQQAIEAAVGNKLFHIIVENERIGKKIIDEMNNQHLPGEVTFIPLNRSYGRHFKYPVHNDAFPIIGKIKYNERFGNVMKNIFGKILLCRDLESAVKFSETFDCVTLDGDKISSDGSLYGGFNSTSQLKKSRIESYTDRLEILNRIENLENELLSDRENIRRENESINETVNELQRIELKDIKTRNMYEKIKNSIQQTNDELGVVKRSINAEEENRIQYISKLKTFEIAEKSLKNEMQQDLKLDFSANDQLLLDNLNDNVHELLKRKKEVIAERIEIENEKTVLENLLENNLLRGKDELSQELHDNFAEHYERHLEVLQSKKLDIEVNLKDIDDELGKLNEQYNVAKLKLDNESKQVEKMEAEIMEIEEQSAVDQELHKLIVKKNLLVESIEDCKRKKADLGILVNSVKNKNFDEKSTTYLREKVKEIHTRLRQFTGIDENVDLKLASLENQKENIIEDEEKFLKNFQRIQELMELLKEFKSGSIEFHFNLINKNFQQIFKKLVPSGESKLCMMENDAGIGISVTFSKSSESCNMRDLNALSGGQRTIVALALIFAIQKCDPAPFYIFDEIDQALDENHRQSVAAMIHELSSNAQFIMTTFRPELLEYANQFYGVRCENRTSFIGPVTREQAASFLDAIPNN